MSQTSRLKAKITSQG